MTECFPTYECIFLGRMTSNSDIIGLWKSCRPSRPQSAGLAV
jgi:hypothetical protein